MSTILNKKEMKNAVVFLATGFEEIEALGTIDVLRRGGVRVMMVSITGDRLVIGAHDIPGLIICSRRRISVASMP